VSRCCLYIIVCLFLLVILVQFWGWVLCLLLWFGDLVFLCILGALCDDVLWCFSLMFMLVFCCFVDVVAVCGFVLVSFGFAFVSVCCWLLGLIYDVCVRCWLLAVWCFGLCWFIIVLVICFWFFVVACLLFGGVYIVLCICVPIVAWFVGGFVRRYCCYGVLCGFIVICFSFVFACVLLFFMWLSVYGWFGLWSIAAFWFVYLFCVSLW